MEDMDDVRRSAGVIADFSRWKGIKGEGVFKKMVIRSKETVVGEEEKKETLGKEEKPAERVINNSTMEEANRPGMSVLTIPEYMKDLVIKMLPTIDKINEKDYDNTIVNAINFAIRFEHIWNDFSRRN